MSWWWLWLLAIVAFGGLWRLLKGHGHPFEAEKNLQDLLPEEVEYDIYAYLESGKTLVGTATPDRACEECMLLSMEYLAPCVATPRKKNS